MAATTTTTLHSFTLLLLLASVFCAIQAAGQNLPPVKNGLSLKFYQSSCPNVESIIRKQLDKEFKKDVGQAAGILRLFFHDCFVRGCEGSVLLKGSASGPGAGEQQAIPNLTLRQKSFEIINDLRRRIEKECGRVVSCSDIVAIAGRDSVVLTGGPSYPVPLGRRDGLAFATPDETLQNLPPPFGNTTTILNMFAVKSLDLTDTVALSGGHTIGIAHCPSFTDRLYPTQDPTMEPNFANTLKKTCPTREFNNTANLDIRSPNIFDNKYFVDLMNRQGLFTSDQDLFTDKRTKDLVTKFAADQSLFFDKFALAMFKLSQLGVLVGNQGEIRADCSVRNGDKAKFLERVVGQAVETLSGF